MVFMYVVFDVACCPVFVCMLCVFLHAAILLIMAALHSRCGHYIFILFLSSFFSSSNISGLRLDVYHTSTNGVVLVQI